MVFEENEMIRMATLPDMYERTITIGSAGKTFSVTGWKLGWALGPEHLLQNCQVEHGPSMVSSNSVLPNRILIKFLAFLTFPACF